MTPKQAEFVRLYIETQNASEAYRLAYNSQANTNTTHRKGYELLQHPEIKREIETMQAEARERNSMTMDDILQELEEARQEAKIQGNASAMVSATMGKAKVLGLDKQKIDLTNSDGSMKPAMPIFNIVGVQPKH